MKLSLPPKPITLAILFLLLTKLVIAGTYYSNSTAPNSTANWWTNTNGTGSHPSNFTTSGDLFILQSGQTCATNSSWVIGSGVTLQIDGTLSINGANDAVTINGTVIFTNASATQITMAGAGSGNTFTVASGATLKTINTNGISGTNCSIIAQATKKTVSLSTTANYELNGSGIQSTLGLPSSVTNFTINNSNGVTINSSFTISGTLTLTNGILVIPTGVTVTITSGNAVGGSGFSSTKHINTQVNTGTGAQGLLRVGNISAAYLFPVGNGTYYMPVTLTPSTTNDFSINVFQGATTDGTPNGTAYSAAVKQTIVDAQWTINRNSGTGSTTMLLGWPAALEGSSFISLPDNLIGITHYGGSWDSPTGSGNHAAKIVSRGGISSFSPFGIGQVNIALPIKFGNIKLSQKNSGLEVEWISLNETNVDHYEIERSTNGQQFVHVSEIRATGNSVSALSYSWMDNAPFNGASFYRIKAVDLDGKSTYSSILKITLGSFKKDISIYPNPVTGSHLAIEAGNIGSGEYQFAIYDLGGKQVFSQSFNHWGGVFSEAIQLPASINHGVYNIRLSGKDISLTKRVLIQ